MSSSVPVITYEYHANNSILSNLPDSYKSDKILLLSIIANNGYELQHVSAVMQNDKDIVLTAIRYYNHMIQEVIESIKNECYSWEYTIKIDLHFLIQNNVFKYASDELKNDRAFVQQAMNICPLVLFEANKRLLKDKELVLMLFNSFPHNTVIYGKLYESLHISLQRDKEIISINQYYHTTIRPTLSKRNERNERII